MSDLLTTWDPSRLTGDWMLAAGDLVAGDDLETSVILSLFTDRLATADDPLPDPTDGDRRGWWADDGAAEGPLGSRLWLISREKETNQVRLRAEDYCREALAWLLEDGVADEITILAEWPRAAPGRLDVGVVIIREGAELLNRRYSWAWSESSRAFRAPAT
jgi:phage gp46-like protein